uniref:EGF-like domain-containing protein n=1 Tax=Anas zonorhyncha TaxID=75864 RepID=A0A8B9UNY5_9AVES
MGWGVLTGSGHPCVGRAPMGADPPRPPPQGANPCEHFGRCVNTQGSFECRCGRGYAGPRCESDVNECLSGPCRNQATCLDRIGRFTCICMAGG